MLDVLIILPTFSVPNIINHFTVGKSTCLSYLRETRLLPLDDVVVVDLDIIRALLPEAPSLSEHSPLTFGSSTQREAGTIAELCLLVAAASFRHVVFEGTLRDIEWHTSYLQGLKSSVRRLREAFVEYTREANASECDELPRPRCERLGIRVGVLHMTASHREIERRVKLRETPPPAPPAPAQAPAPTALQPGSRLLQGLRQQRPGPKNSPSMWSRWRPHPVAANNKAAAVSSSPASSVAKGRASRSRLPPVPPRPQRPSPFPYASVASPPQSPRRVPSAVLEASFATTDFSSLTPLARLNAFQPPPTPGAELLGPENGREQPLEPAIDILVSLDLSGPLPSIAHPWHFDWADFKAVFEARHALETRPSPSPPSLLSLSTDSDGYGSDPLLSPPARSTSPSLLLSVLSPRARGDVELPRTLLMPTPLSKPTQQRPPKERFLTISSSASLTTSSSTPSPPPPPPQPQQQSPHRGAIAATSPACATKRTMRDVGFGLGLVPRFSLRPLAHPSKASESRNWASITSSSNCDSSADDAELWGSVSISLTLGATSPTSSLSRSLSPFEESGLVISSWLHDMDEDQYTSFASSTASTARVFSYNHAAAVVTTGSSCLTAFSFSSSGSGHSEEGGDKWGKRGSRSVVLHSPRAAAVPAVSQQVPSSPFVGPRLHRSLCALCRLDHHPSCARLHHTT